MAFDKNASKYVPRRVLSATQINDSNNIKFTLGENLISNAKIKMTGDKTEKKDAQGNVMFVVPKGRGCEVTFDCHVADLALFAAMNGTSRNIADVSNKIVTPKTEYVDITSNNQLSIVLAKSAVNDGTAAVPVYNIAIAKLTTDGSLKYNLTQGSVVDENVFVYTLATNTVSFEADTLAVGDKLMIVYYYENADAAAVTVKSNEYPIAAKTIFRVEGCTVCNDTEAIDIWYVFPSALLSTDSEIDMGDPEAVVSVSMTCTYDYCSNDKEFYTTILADD
jgi:hypothetical protein